MPNRSGHQWSLTRRWEPQARHSRRPDAATVKFTDRALTERYVGSASHPDWFRTTLDAAGTEALIIAADANRLGACSIVLQEHVLCARYRTGPDAVPDLRETLAALEALAQLLDADGAGTSVDLTREALLTRADPKRVGHVDSLQVDDSRLTCTLARPAGVRAKFRSAPSVVVDWGAAAVMLPEGELPLPAVRQVVFATGEHETTVLIVDVGGDVAFAGQCSRTVGPTNLTGEREPPLVYVDVSP